MQRLIFLWSLALLACFIGNAQDTSINNFIPEGYKLFDKVYGDLNNDGAEDCVLMIKKVDPANIVLNRSDEKVDRNRRGIIVLFKNKNSYKLGIINQQCFSSENEDGGVYYPPELYFKIKNNKLYIHYGHGRYGYWAYNFRYQDNAFALIGYEGYSSRGPVTLSETSINFLTKKKLVRENTNQDDEGNNEVFKETWSTINLEKLIKFSDIKDFDEFYVGEM